MLIRIRRNGQLVAGRRDLQLDQVVVAAVGGLSRNVCNDDVRLFHSCEEYLLFISRGDVQASSFSIRIRSLAPLVSLGGDQDARRKRIYLCMSNASTIEVFVHKCMYVQKCFARIIGVSQLPSLTARCHHCQHVVTPASTLPSLPTPDCHWIDFSFRNYF